MKRKPLRRKTPLRAKPPTEAQKARRKRRKATLKRKYLRPEWRALRAEALARDRGLCRVLSPRCLGDADQVHHLRYGRGRGVRRLLVPLDDLVSVCSECHAFLEEAKRAPEPPEDPEGLPF